jgi:hypothetical protein
MLRHMADNSAIGKSAIRFCRRRGCARELRLGMAKILKTTPCKVTRRRWHGCFDRSRKNILTRRANQWQFCIITKFAKTAMTLPDSGLFGAITGQNFRQLKLQPNSSWRRHWFSPDSPGETRYLAGNATGSPGAASRHETNLAPSGNRTVPMIGCKVRLQTREYGRPGLWAPQAAAGALLPE